MVVVGNYLLYARGGLSSLITIVDLVTNKKLGDMRAINQAKCLLVVNDVLYVGCADGGVYRFSLYGEQVRCLYCISFSV